MRVRAALGGVIVLALLGLGTAVVGAVLTPGGETVAVSNEQQGDAPRAATDGANGNAEPAPGVDVVVVHVLGAVLEPGIIELPLGSRVVDAIAAVRGPTDDADLAGINLARIVADGEQLVVPRIGEVPVSVPAAGGQSGGLVNINSADATTLETLAGVGPALAARIIAWREQNGPFRSVDELTAVSGIGPSTLDGMRAQVTV